MKLYAGYFVLQDVDYTGEYFEQVSLAKTEGRKEFFDHLQDVRNKQSNGKNE